MMGRDRWPKITIQFPQSFALRDFADALKLPPEAVIEIEANGLGAVLVRELSARIPGKWVGANVANRPVVEAMSDDELHACGLRRARWETVSSLDVRKGDRVRWPLKSMGVVEMREATVAEWLDGRTVLMEDGVTVDPTCDTRWERLE